MIEGAPLDALAREAVACSARLIADLEEFGLLPDGVSRREALQVAVEFSSSSGPFPAVDRAFLEADYIECLFLAGQFDDAFQRVEWSLVDHAAVPEALSEILLQSANAKEYLGEYAEALDLAQEADDRMADAAASGAQSGPRRLYAACVQAKILVQIGVLDEAQRIIAQALASATAEDIAACQSSLLTTETELANAREDQAWVVEHVGAALVASDFDQDSPADRLKRELDVAQASALISMKEGRGLSEAASVLGQTIDRIGLHEPATWSPVLTLCDLELARGSTEAALELLERAERFMRETSARAPLIVRSNRAGARGRIVLRMTPDIEAHRSARIDAEAALEELVVAWRSVPHRKGGIGFLHFDERRSLLATLAQLDAAVLGPAPGAECALARVLQIEAEGSLVESMDSHTANMDLVRTLLVPRGGGLVVFLPSSTASTAISLDKAGARLWILPSSDTWDDASLRLGSAMQPQNAAAPGSADRIGVLAEQVRDKLFPAGLDALISTWNEVVFVRADNLGWVPFEVLPLACRDGRLLGQELATSYLPSLRLGLALAARQGAEAPPESTQPAAAILIAVGSAPSTESGPTAVLAPIPWQKSDGRRLGAPWPSSMVDVELDASRAVERLLTSGVDGTELLVVIAHGIRDADRERSQGFAFSDEARVFPSDLDAMQAPRTVALVVCGANAGRARRGDDLGSHLVSSFLAGGATTVLSARTDLSFEASVALLEVFHQGTARGLALSHALLEARRNVARTEGWNHPAFHSNLTLTGLGLRPVHPSLIRRN